MENSTFNIDLLFQDQVNTLTMSDPSNLFATGMSGESGGPSAFVTKGEEVPRSYGFSNHGRDFGRYYGQVDHVAALAKPVEVSFTTDSVMAFEVALRKTYMLLKRVGLDKESDGVQAGFIDGMLLCAAVNSSSLASPNRATFSVGGSVFNLSSDVKQVLGDDSRRYFRAYADLTRKVLERVIQQYCEGPVDGDFAKFEMIRDQYEAIKRVAEVRGLTRAMYLIHDSSDCCSGLTSTERALLAQSKSIVFSSQGAHNPVDNPVAGRVNTGATRVGAVSVDRPSVPAGLAGDY